MVDGCKRMEHMLYGVVDVLATDGCHAVVSGGGVLEHKRVTVAFENLKELDLVGATAGSRKVKKVVSKIKVGTPVNHDAYGAGKVEEVEDNAAKVVFMECTKWMSVDSLTVIRTKKRVGKKKDGVPKKSALLGKLLAMVEDGE